MSMKIALCGGTGLLGSTLGPFLISQGYEVLAIGRHDGARYCADLENSGSTFRLFDALKPDCIVNLIGLTDVDRCEKEPNQAYLTNVHTVENIAAWIKRSEISCHLVHISTDHVYDRGGRNAEDQVKIVNCYAFSKYAGELAAAGVSSTILRTNFFGRSYCPTRTSLTDWLFSALKKQSPIKVFKDVNFTPLSMLTLSEMIELSIKAKPVGVFNLGSREGMSKADFAFSFARRLGLSTREMTCRSIDDIPALDACRPKNMCMDSQKFEYGLGVQLPVLEDEIARVAEEYRENC
jgi:dTDP-4-dehydrorhamnose reductase